MKRSLGWTLAALALASCGGASPSAGTAQPDSGMVTAPLDGGTSDGATPDTGGVDGNAADGASPKEAGPPAPDPCIEAGTCPPGTWVNVTPSNVDLTDPLDCSNYGTSSIQVDPGAPSNLYAEYNCQGVWKSADYGMTWTGPINTGTGGATVGDAAGGVVIAPGPAGGPPVLYQSGIRGAGTGFWKSTDGGQSWTNYVIGPAGSRQDVYPPAVDPYDGTHLVMAGHEQDLLVESIDGGQTWTNVTLAAGMMETGGTGAISFIDTGLSFSTRVTWLWMAQGSGGMYGTWRTSDGGMTWTQVDTNEHPHGAYQIYQPDTSGVVYMAGIYSALGWGVLRSTDFGSTWAHVGGTGSEGLVFGTPKNVYAMWGWPIGEGQVVAPSLETAAQPGLGTWSMQTTPAGMSQGPGQVAVTSDGTHSIVLAACFNAGMWRYVEP